MLELDGLAGLEGWRWLFLMEGLPAVALGVVTLRYLDERPGDARCLEPEERELLAAEVARERELKEAVGVGSLGASLRNGQVWLLSLIYFLIVGAAFGLTFFVPDLVQDRTGYSDFEVGTLAAVPYGVATVAMLVIVRRADAAIGNLGGFAGPAFTGISEDQTGGFEMPLTVLAATLVLGSALVLFARERGVPDPEPEPAAA